MEFSKIQNKIYEIRGQKVMLDFDLAELYEVETKVLNQGVKRNKPRFPGDFMFQLTEEEWNNLKSQFVTSSYSTDTADSPGRGKWGGTRKLPFAFTEHGVTMLASVLRSEKAIKMNIAIVRAFITLRQFAINYKDLAVQVNELKASVGNHNAQLNEIYIVLEKLLEEKANQQKWEDRQLIGFT